MDHKSPWERTSTIIGTDYTRFKSPAHQHRGCFILFLSGPGRPSIRVSWGGLTLFRGRVVIDMKLGITIAGRNLTSIQLATRCRGAGATVIWITIANFNNSQPCLVSENASRASQNTLQGSNLPTFDHRRLGSLRNQGEFQTRGSTGDYDHSPGSRHEHMLMKRE